MKNTLVPITILIISEVGTYWYKNWTKKYISEIPNAATPVLAGLLNILGRKELKIPNTYEKMFFKVSMISIYCCLRKKMRLFLSNQIS